MSVPDTTVCTTVWRTVWPFGEDAAADIGIDRELLLQSLPYTSFSAA